MRKTNRLTVCRLQVQNGEAVVRQRAIPGRRPLSEMPTELNGCVHMRLVGFDFQ